MSGSNKRLVFLFGAGVSQPACLPLMKDITKKVLTPDGVYRGGDGYYYLDDKSSDISITNAIRQMLEVIAKIVEEYYSDKKRRESHYFIEPIIHYEDYYSYAHALYIGIIWNRPEAFPLLKDMEKRIQQLIKKSKASGEKIQESEWARGYLYNEVMNYIHDIVWHMLEKKPEETAYLKFLNKACSDRRYTGIDIFTTNYDSVIERFFSSQEIQYVDGFEADADGDVRWLNTGLFDEPDVPVRLFKLHGAINWFRFNHPFENSGPAKVALSKSKDHWYHQNANGINLPLSCARPLILIGTSNKVFEYYYGVFLDLLSRFQRILEGADRLVVSGFSFADMGITKNIFGWLRSKQSRRMLVIDPGELWIKQNPEISQKTDFIKEWIDKIEYEDDIQPFLQR